MQTEAPTTRVSTPDAATMPWLEDRAAELRQAETEKRRLKQQSLQAGQTVDALQREYDRLTRQFETCTARRYRTNRNILAARESQSRSAGILRRAERTVQRYVLPSQFAYTG